MAEDMELSAFQANLAELDREIAALSKRDQNPNEFFRVFLDRLVSVLGEGGAVWRVGEDGQLIFDAHINLAVAGLEQGGRQEQLLVYSLSTVLETKQSLGLPARQSGNIYDGGLGQAGSNESPHTVVFVPVLIADQVAAIVLLISPADVDPRAVRGYLGFLEGLAQWAGAYLQRQKLSQLQKQLDQGGRVREFIRSLHMELHPTRVCYVLSNYAQEMLGVYRCMAGVFSAKGKFRLESISGVETVAVKSNFIQSISTIARQVCRNDKALLVENPDAAMNAVSVGQEDDLLTAARLYMLQAKAQVMGVFPIHWEGVVVGAFVVEKVKEEPIEAQEAKRIEGLLEEAGSALSNAMRYRNLPFSLLIRSLGSLREKIYRLGLSRQLVWGGLLFMLLLTPAVLRKQVKVMGEAELSPRAARIGYANQTGVIEQVSIPDDRRVQAGQVLAVLDRKLIDREIDRANDSISETELLYLSAKRNMRDAEAQKYQYRRKAFQAELAIYELQRAEYEIRSPVSGVVITRESELRLLERKPVERGEAIVEVVPEDTPWQMRVSIPEDEAGELLRAWDSLESGGKLRARFILNMYPGMRFESYVVSVARRAHVMSVGEKKYRNVIEVWVAEPEGLREKIDPRQGMEGKVAIECGKRSLYYAMTHEFVDFIRVSLF